MVEYDTTPIINIANDCPSYNAVNNIVVWLIWCRVTSSVSDMIFGKIKPSFFSIKEIFDNV